MTIIPKFRIQRVPSECHAGGKRALPAYLEVRWFNWRRVWWLGPKLYLDGHR